MEADSMNDVTHKHMNTDQAAVRDTLFVCDPQHLPWAPWAMRGTSFKLLSADPDSGRFSLLIRFDRDCEAPAHRHIGAVEGMVLDGGFHYADAPEQRFTSGMYVLERDGAVHQPVSPEGALMFAVFHGPVEGLAEDGSITGRIDCQWHIDTWHAFLTAHGAPNVQGSEARP